MKNKDALKNQLCSHIQCFSNQELYSFITGDHPFRILICEKCTSLFGECQESENNDTLCKDRFSRWCETNVSNSSDYL